MHADKAFHETPNQLQSSKSDAGGNPSNLAFAKHLTPYHINVSLRNCTTMELTETSITGYH